MWGSLQPRHSETAPVLLSSVESWVPAPAKAMHDNAPFQQPRERLAAWHPLDPVTDMFWVSIGSLQRLIRLWLSCP